MARKKPLDADDMLRAIANSAHKSLKIQGVLPNSILGKGARQGKTSNNSGLDASETPRSPQGTAGAAADANTHAKLPNIPDPTDRQAATPSTPLPPPDRFTSVFDKIFDGDDTSNVNTDEGSVCSTNTSTAPSPQPSLQPASQPQQSASSAISSSAPSPAQPTSATILPAGSADNPFIAFVARYRKDPASLVRNVFQAQPDVWQEEFLNHIKNGERRISVRAGHGVGKSTACAWAVIWHLITRYPQKVVCTAPTAPQLYDALFAEIKFWINKLPKFMRELFDITSDRIVLKSSPEGSFVSARTSSKEKPEALAGVHSEHVLLIVDEASAVEEAVFESAAGSMSGHNATTILIGNPTRSSGLFYKTHHDLRAEWKTMHVSCVTSPRVTEDFVKQIKDTYGELSNAFRVRVLGEFPLADDDTLIPAELVDAAVTRDIAEDDGEPIIFGVDPARFGDDAAVLCVRRGNIVLSFRQWRGLDLMSLCGAIVNEASTHKPVEINVDSIGLGAGLADRLRELGQPVRDVNVSEVSALNPKANRLRDELWISVRDFLAQRACKIPSDENLRADLVTPKYSFTSSGKLQVESKSEMKKRLRRSPDYADAMALTFAGRGAMVGGRMASWVPGKPLRRRLSIV